MDWFEEANRCLDAGRLKSAIRFFTLFLRSEPADPVDVKIATGNRGIAYVQCGEFELALADFNAVIELDPLCSTAFNNRGNLHGDMGLYDEALQDYSEALRLGDFDPGIYENLARTYAELGMFERGIAELDKILAYQGRKTYESDSSEFESLELPSDPLGDSSQLDSGLLAAKFSACTLRSELLFELGLMGEVLTALGQAESFAQSPEERASVFYFRGRFFSNTELFSEALNQLNQAILLNPRSIRSLDARGIVRYRLGEFEQAVEDHSRALEICTDEDPIEQVLNNRALAFRQLQMFEQAKTDFDQAIEIEPEFALFYFNRGLAKADFDNPDQDLPGAEADFRQALELNTQFLDARIELSRIYFLQEQPLKALSCLEEQAEEFAENEEFRSLKAFLNLELRQFEAAYDLLSGLVSDFPKQALHRDRLGIVRQRLGDFQGALADHTLAIELSEQKMASAFSNRGIAKRALKKLDEALQDFNRAIELEPNEPDYYSNRANIHLELGNSAQANLDRQAAQKLEDSDNFPHEF